MENAVQMLWKKLFPIDVSPDGMGNSYGAENWALQHLWYVLRVNQIGRPVLLRFQRDDCDGKWRKRDAVIRPVLTSGRLFS